MRRLGHVPALDGIRGIAIAAVVAYHFFGLPGGFMGVDLFFVLSGFLITTLLLEDGRLSRFYRRRAARLLPALGVLLLVLLTLVGRGWLRVAEGGFYLANFFRAFATPDPLTGTPVDHLWSLAEEEQFYLVWPLVLLATLRYRRPYITVGLAGFFLALVCYRVGLAATGSSLRRLYFGPDTHADGLVLGCLAALVRPKISALAGRVGVLVLVVFFALGAFGAGWLAYGLPFFEVAAVLAVLAAVEGHLPELTVKPLVWLGLISYSLYLWHQPVHILMPHHPWIGLPISFALAWLSYRFVEQPFRHRRSPAPEPAATPSAAASAAPVEV